MQVKFPRLSSKHTRALRPSLAVPSAAALTAAGLIGLVALGWLLPSESARARAAVHQSQTPTQSQTRADRSFEFSVRSDFFAGLAGDSQALERAMKLCEETLAKEPKNAEAMVWHGGGTYFRAKDFFRAGDVARGNEARDRGLKEMDDAVALRPSDVAVLIPRAALLLSAAQHVPSPAVARKNFEKAVGDYEKVSQLQADYFNTLSVHARGELLGALAEGWQGLGNAEKSRQYLTRITRELDGTLYARKAAVLLAQPVASGSLGITCQGCHSPYAPKS